jgi:outer membrane lipoprotein-sorting protein
MSLAVWFLLSAGCARVSRPPDVAPAPADLSAQELIARLQERGSAIQTLKAQFSIEASGKEIKGTQRMEVAMIYQRPDLVRLRAFARIGFPIFDLVLIQDRYHMKIPMQGKFLSGSVAEIERQKGLGPSILLGIQATMGNLNGTTVLATDKLSLRAEGGLYILEVIPAARTAGARRLWFDQGTLELVRQEFLDSSREIQATIVFEDYRSVGTTAVGASGRIVPIVRPYLIRAEDANGRAKLLLTFREIIPNPHLSPEDWGISAAEPLIGTSSGSSGPSSPSSWVDPQSVQADKEMSRGTELAVEKN